MKKKGGNKKGGKKNRASIQQDPEDNGVSKMQATTSQPPVSPTVAKSAPSAREEVKKWAARALDKGIQGLREEFGELKRYCPPDMQITTFQAHWDAGRNRYKDVPCQEKFRPLDCTITDFWHMVVQEETETVIMLCNIKEKGMDKCAQYWPLEEKEVKTYGDVEVTNTFIRPLNADEPNIRLSILSVKWKEDGKEKTREVRHYQWIDWPDRGVPPCKLTAMALLSTVRGTKKPIVVHCSAGIGRTGSIVAIEFILERLQQGIPCEAMDEILKELRSQRPYSIQTDLQYLYVHRVMLFYFFEKYKVAVAAEDLQAKYKKFVEDYEKATA
uniref:Protein tyrosine phosphatase n=1 Tax=Panagrolaimus superbus TaxID=310955 RepID=A0A914YZ95_9BILA